MRRKACGLLVLMLAVASVTACKTGKETAEQGQVPAHRTAPPKPEPAFPKLANPSPLPKTTQPQPTVWMVETAPPRPPRIVKIPFFPLPGKAP